MGHLRSTNNRFMNGEKSKICKDYLLKYPKLSYTDIAKTIMRDQDMSYDVTVMNAWRVLLYKVAAVNNIIKEVTVDASKDDDKYVVVDNHYDWKANKGSIHMSVDFIDQLFYEYSEKGLNLSQTEIINKHNLQVWQWTTIKNTLWLFKKSNIFSPHTVENTPKEELRAMIEEKMDKLFSNVGYQVEQQYNKALNKKAKASIKTESQKELELQSVILELTELLPTCQVKVIKRQTQPISDAIINVFIYDLHFGIENDHYLTKILPQYDVSVTVARLREIAEEINKIGAAKVNVFFGGDIIETFSGLNHLDSFKGVAKGYWGSRVVMESYKVLVEFISLIANVDKVYSVPGNHDRSSESGKVDSEGYINQIIFELIRLSFRDHIDVTFDSRLISVTIDGIHYLVSHGHLKMSDMNPADMILEYGEPKLFNLLISGHFHERKVKRDTKNFRQLVCPEAGGINDYTARNGYLSQPGFLAIKNNGKGKPLVMDYALR